jgi:hypothetical protein
MFPGCDIALAMLETAAPQPGQHSLATLVDDAARTPLIPGGEPDPSDDEQPLYAARRKVYPQRVSGTYRRVKWAVLCITRSASITCCRSCAGIVDRTRRAKRC